MVTQNSGEDAETLYITRTLLMEKLNATATPENCLSVFYKTNHANTLQASNYSQEQKLIFTENFKHVYSSFIHSSQKLEINQMSFTD